MVGISRQFGKAADVTLNDVFIAHYSRLERDLLFRPRYCVPGSGEGWGTRNTNA